MQSGINSTLISRDTPSQQTMYFYPIYCGWSFREEPPIFLLPAQALTWQLSRFKKDGLSNIWGPGLYPDFLKFVGTVAVHQSCIKSISLPSNRPSKIENAFFSNVKFFEVSDSSKIVQSSYTRINEDIFILCSSTMKDTPDYQASSNSIYRATKCTQGSRGDHKFVHSPFLSSKKKSDSKFIMLEKRFEYLKRNEYRNIGMFNCSHICQNKNKYLNFMFSIHFR